MGENNKNRVKSQNDNIKFHIYKKDHEKCNYPATTRTIIKIENKIIRIYIIIRINNNMKYKLGQTDPIKTIVGGARN